MDCKYKRILLKLSGEALSNEGGFGLNFKKIKEVCEQIKILTEMNIQVAIVVGGGNFWRGRSGDNMDRTRADHMGMLATTINALAILDTLESVGVQARVQTGIEMKQIAEPYIRNKAIRHLEKGRVVVFGCGTGNPFFSTDTAASLRAAEIEADVILLAKNVDGVYTADPNIDKSAIKFDSIKYIDVLNKGLKVMDSTAISLCMDNNIPIEVFGLDIPENIIKVVKGEKIGTYVGE
ncbi:MAG: UMP kinase [Ruminococcaceae bacterium]|nr:UMP kinase [Oscillospiraceae bacterium]